MFPSWDSNYGNVHRHGSRRLPDDCPKQRVENYSSRSPIMQKGDAPSYLALWCLPNKDTSIRICPPLVAHQYAETIVDDDSSVIQEILIGPVHKTAHTA